MMKLEKFTEITGKTNKIETRSLQKFSKLPDRRCFLIVSLHKILSREHSIDHLRTVENTQGLVASTD